MKVILTWSLSQNTLLYHHCCGDMRWLSEVKYVGIVMKCYTFPFALEGCTLGLLFGVSELLLLCFGAPLSNTIKVMLCCAQSHVWVMSDSDPMDCSLPGSSVHRILQARLEWVAMAFPRGSSRPRDWTCIFCVSCIAGRFFTHWAIWEPKYNNDYLITSTVISRQSFDILDGWKWKK